MTDPGQGSPPRAARDDVAADLAAIEHRLKSAQAELERVTRERQEALDRLAKLHAERMAEHDDGDADDDDAA